MYTVRESIINGEITGYFVDEKIRGVLVESFFITISPKTCSCNNYLQSKNPHNHFHINLVENWIKHNKPQAAMYAKSKKGKILTLCPGFVKN